MKKLFVKLIGLSLLLAGCETVDPLESLSGLRTSADCAVCGTWNYSSFEQRSTTDYVWVYTRANEFGNQAGLKFSSDGRFVERANAGWCGTPPITYADYNGQWRQEGDSLAIDSKYWGGRQQSKIAIISLDQDKLVIKRVYKP